MNVSKPTGYYKNVYLKEEDYLSWNEMRQVNRQKWFWRSLLILPGVLIAVLAILTFLKF